MGWATSAPTTTPPENDTLEELVEEFRNTTGRRDLSLRQVYRYIHEGQMFLDEQTDCKFSKAQHVQKIESGIAGISFPSRARVVQRVDIIDTARQRTILTKTTLEEMQEYYVDGISSISTGTPSTYALSDIRLFPQYFNYMSLVQYFDQMDFALRDSARYYSLLLMPPADGDYVVSIRGKFYNPRLGLNKSNWWLENQFGILLLAARRAVEATYGNTAGVHDFTNAVMPTVNQLNNDFAEEEAVGINKMEG